MDFILRGFVPKFIGGPPISVKATQMERKLDPDFELLGGDWNMNGGFFHSVGKGIIIPSDELTPSFFREVAKKQQPDYY